MVWPYLERLRSYRSREVGSLKSSGAFRVALCYPNVYSVASASLGFQSVYRIIHEHPGMSASRAMWPDPDMEEYLSSMGVLTIEDETPLSAYPVVAFSMSYEMDILGILRMLEAAGIKPLRKNRDDDDPFILMGGPITFSNPLPLAPFADAIMMGEGEETLGPVLEILRSSDSNNTRRDKLAQIPGMYVPEHHGLLAPNPHTVDSKHLPAYSAYWSPDSEFTNMFLIEASRGCPRYCKFCIVRASNTPMRYQGVDSILAHIPENAPRVGFVGAGVSEYPQIKDALRVCVERGQGVGLSSLRADCLDDEFVELLVRGGARTMTIASDAPSERQRKKMAKALKEQHLIDAAQLARKHKIHRLKIYAIIGLPDEDQSDIDELVRFSLDLSRIHKLTLAVNPLVPKLRTPLAQAPYQPIKELERKINYLRKKLQGRVTLRSLSPKWGWVETVLSLGGPAVGMASLEVSRKKGSFQDWKSAFSSITKPNEAISIAEEHHLEAVLPHR